MNENEEKILAERVLHGIKSYEVGSSKLTTWSLSVIGGSILIIIDNTYFRPLHLCQRYFYFLFVIGWAFLGSSMYHSFTLTRMAMVKDLYTHKSEFLVPILEKCNNAFKWQLRFFQWAMLAFGVWLVVYLLWWIFLNFK